MASVVERRFLERHCGSFHEQLGVAAPHAQEQLALGRLVAELGALAAPADLLRIEEGLEGRGECGIHAWAGSIPARDPPPRSDSSWRSPELLSLRD
jgi:hypothetical protein